MSKDEPYNPLDKKNLGRSVAEMLLRSPVWALRHTDHLMGAGVYAIYYAGPLRFYAPIKSSKHEGQFSYPIYVGKAIPRGARKGGLTFDAGRGRALRDRLRQHAGTIEEVDNLHLRHFYYQALTVDDVWIALGERVLIEQFQPLWNRVVDGFGNKTPGRGRAVQKRSPWDVLHPGRKFVRDLALPAHHLSNAVVAKRIKDFFAGRLSESEKVPLGEEGNDW